MDKSARSVIAAKLLDEGERVEAKICLGFYLCEDCGEIHLAKEGRMKPTALSVLPPASARQQRANQWQEPEPLTVKKQRLSPHRTEPKKSIEHLLVARPVTLVSAPRDELRSVGPAHCLPCVVTEYDPTKGRWSPSERGDLSA